MAGDLGVVAAHKVCCVVCLNTTRVERSAVKVFGEVPLCDQHLLSAGSSKWVALYGDVDSLALQVECMRKGFDHLNQFNRRD